MTETTVCSSVTENFTNEIKEEIEAQPNGSTNGTAVRNRNVTITKNGAVDVHCKLPKEIGTDHTFKRKIVWFNTIGFIILHIAALYGLFLMVTARAHFLTTFLALALGVAAGEGVTIGAHRMWSHKTFKAHFIVRLVLIILHTMAGQNCLYIWVRDHRLHHKYSDTDADPHNANRGFFFSHMGWLMSKKHPAVIAKGRTIDMSDLEADPLVMIQKTFYKSWYLIFAITIPVLIPVYLWNESYINAFFVTYMFRYIISLHGTWLVNSAAHLYGTKPYDKTLKPVESKFVSFVSMGEGWHNYHHAFPWDYRASEYGTKYNISTMIIDLLAFFGLVWDRREAPEAMVESRCQKLGDGSHPVYGNRCCNEEECFSRKNTDEINGNVIKEKDTNQKANKSTKRALMAFPTRELTAH